MLPICEAQQHGWTQLQRVRTGKQRVAFLHGWTRGDKGRREVELAPNTRLFLPSLPTEPSQEAMLVLRDNKAIAVFDDGSELELKGGQRLEFGL